MTIPILESIRRWGPSVCAEPLDEEGELADCVLSSGVTFDILCSFTCLIVGILGALGTITMSPAATYALIGVSCFITAAWLALCIDFCVEELPTR